MRSPLSAILMLLLVAAPALALALDHPSSAATLKLSTKNGKQKLVFVSKDGGSLFPAIGSPDDPATAGALVEVVPVLGIAGSLAVPAGSGSPGWIAKPAAIPSHKFQNKLAPAGISGVHTAFFRQGKQIKIIAKSLGGAMFGPNTTQVGIRITTGSLRNCSLFGPATIKRASSDAFSAANAPASALADCSDTSIGLPSGCESSDFPTCGGPCDYEDEVCTPGFGNCRCVGPSTPCNGSAPTCGGVCPAGETCTPYGTVVPSCMCLPDGATPCGDPGVPTCGGACASGEVCRPAFSAPIFGGQLGCGCAAPAPCGAGGLDCPNGFACAHFGPNSICAPIGCGGTYPTCGGACGDGGECQAVNLNAGSYAACVCAVPAPCDTCGGGYTCPSGQVCAIDSTGNPTTCGCE